MSLLFRFITSTTLFLLILATFSQGTNPFQKNEELLRLYKEAEKQTIFITAPK